MRMTTEASGILRFLRKAEEKALPRLIGSYDHLAINKLLRGRVVDFVFMVWSISAVLF